MTCSNQRLITSSQFPGLFSLCRHLFFLVYTSLLWAAEDQQVNHLPFIRYLDLTNDPLHQANFQVSYLAYTSPCFYAFFFLAYIFPFCGGGPKRD